MKSPIIILTESLPSKVEVAKGGLEVVLEVVHVQWPHSPGLETQSGHDMLLGQLSPTIKTQHKDKASKAPFRDISCFTLCQYGGIGELTADGPRGDQTTTNYLV